MKIKKIIIAFVTSCLFFTSCDKEHSKKDIIGEWKLTKISVVDTTILDGYYQQFDVDYSDNNIVYNFQKNKKLIITSSTLGEMQNKKYSYKYHGQNDCILCDPPPNLFIDESVYYCKIFIGNETMLLSGCLAASQLLDEVDLAMMMKDDIIGYSKHFTKIK